MDEFDEPASAINKIVDALYVHIFSDPELNTYAVLDGASIPDLLEHLETDAPEYVCLYRGELSEDLEAAAPYLVRILPDTPFTEWLLTEGWGNHWGIFALSKADMREMRKHFRTFLIVKDPEGKQIYFRYYDPRVLRIYLPTTNEEEKRHVFGPITSYCFEGAKQGELLRFDSDREKMEGIDLLDSLRRESNSD